MLAGDLDSPQTMDNEKYSDYTTYATDDQVIQQGWFSVLLICHFIILHLTLSQGLGLNHCPPPISNTHKELKPSITYSNPLTMCVNIKRHFWLHDGVHSLQ